MHEETAYRGAAPAFPPSVEEVPPARRVRSREDGLMLAMALGFAILSVGYAVECALEPAHPTRGLAGFSLAAVAFGAFEVFVIRRARVTLAFDGEWIGVYRRGTLARVIGRGQLVRFELSTSRTMKNLFASGFGVLVAPLLGCMGVYGAREPDDRRQLFFWSAAVAVAMTTWAVGTVRARLRSKSFVVDTQTGMDHAFAASELARFGL